MTINSIQDKLHRFIKKYNNLKRNFCIYSNLWESTAYQGQCMNISQRVFHKLLHAVNEPFYQKNWQMNRVQQDSIFWLLIGMGMRKFLFAFSLGNINKKNNILVETEGTIFGDKRHWIVDIMLLKLVYFVNW